MEQENPSKMLYDFTEQDLVFAMGIRFWSNLVQTQQIKSYKKCSEVLETVEFLLEREVNNEIIPAVQVEDETHVKKNQVAQNPTFTSEYPLNSLHVELPAESQENKHISVNEIENKFKCKFCEFQDNIFQPLKVHMKNYHANKYHIFLIGNKHMEKEEKCEYCDNVFKNFDQLKAHVSEEHKSDLPRIADKLKSYKCKICDKLFFSKKESRKHERKDHKLYKTEKLPSGKYKRGKPRLVIGYNDDLPVKYRRTCNKCDKSFGNLNRYSDHLKRHEMGRKPYTCDQCGRSFSFRLTLKKHYKLHSDIVDGILCNRCGESFTTKWDMSKHMQQNHKKKIEKIDVQENTCNFCDKCGDLFSNKSNYYYHIKTKHGQIELVCEICSFKTGGQNVMRKHKESHLPPSLPCYQCGKLFKGPLYLRKHEQRVHSDTKSRPFQCKECGKGFTLKQTYEGHMNMHQGIKPYICSHCGIGFQNASNRIAHTKKIHPDEFVNKAPK